MTLPGVLVSMFLLVLIAVSDFKTRQIPVVILTGEIILSAFLLINLVGSSAIIMVCTNLFLLSIEIFLLWLWSNFVSNQPNEGLWSKFGMGDLIFLIIAALNFSLLNYLTFIVVVSISSLLIWLIITSFRCTSDKTIPYAGFLAVGLLTVRFFQLTTNSLNFYSDNLILNLIYGAYQ